MAKIQHSELILNPDGSVYHLNLRPEEIAPVILTVGDPGRVPMVSKYFDEIIHIKNKREFLTHTGRIGKIRVSVISTGIGPDNIDIALNELDALFNVDFTTRTIKEKITPLQFIRIGTSGALQEDIPVDSFVASAYGIGMDNLMDYYKYRPNLGEAELTDDLNDFLSFSGKFSFYITEGSPILLKNIGADMVKGLTMTAPGFYAPQGRSIRLSPRYDVNFFRQLSHYKYKAYPLTNLEMETSAIYGLCRLLGHQALSTNAIIANRQNGTFSKKPKETVDRLIRHVLEKVSEL